MLMHFEPDPNVSSNLALYGLSPEEIEEIHEINTNVKKGRELLSKTFLEYDTCIDEIEQVKRTISITQTTVDYIKQQLDGLCRLHFEQLNEITSEFLRNLLDKHEAIMLELQSNEGLLICKRDKLEAIIQSLGTTYNVIRNAPMTHTCPICMTNEVDTYLEPCGHTFCHSCFNVRALTHCHMCRTKVRTPKNIFYS
jgi:hypothetical protein